MQKPMPYSGTEPFIYVSFAKADEQAATDIISKLQADGCRVCFDNAADRKDKSLTEKKIKGCEIFIALFSNGYTASDLCQTHLIAAHVEGKKRIAVFLETTTLSLGTRFRLLPYKTVKKYLYSSDEDFCRSLYESESFAAVGLINALQFKKPGFAIKDGVLTDYIGDREHVFIPQTVTKIGETAFSNKGGVRTVFIPSSVEIIEQSAFCGCPDLTNIFLPDSLKYVGQRSFADCSSLARVILPNQIEKIPAGAFRNCRRLERVIIGDGVTEIGEGAFKHCASLTEVIIGARLKKLAADAFEGCPHPLTIRYKGSRESWSKIISGLGWKKGEGKYIVYFNQKGPK